MTSYATITSKGQLTLPVEVRRALGLQAGQRVAITVEDDRLILEPPASLDALRARLREEATAAGTWGAGRHRGRGLAGPRRDDRRLVTSIDSNGLLRWLLDDVPGAADKVERRLAADGPVTIADVALVEVVFVLEKVMGVSRRTVADSVRVVLADGRYDCDRGGWRTVVDTWPERPELSVVDVYLAEVARRDGSVPLLTFDRKLANELHVAESF